jgi:predicted nucleotidyltransferase
MGAEVQQGVVSFCRRIAADLTGEGARAVVLVGSHSRGDATAESDVDLLVIGDGPGYQLSLRESKLMAVSWRTEDQQRQRFMDPATAVTEIPGWRSGLILKDCDGIGEVLRREAIDWSWDRIEENACRWVAAELTGYAEEVHKLVAAVRYGRPRTAAVQRSLLAVHLPIAMAVHLRTLCASENVVWDTIADQMGEQWRARQDRALGLDTQAEPDSCLAALELYCQAVSTADHLFGERERDVVTEAVVLARNLMEDLSRGEGDGQCPR